ncbi:hypothetical protein C8R44DRAFT_885826 [Mycena epipterygia]|nr:hypothetical protein C8R44DRAFT_885826 [Mycena epipterygia]
MQQQRYSLLDPPESHTTFGRILGANILMRDRRDGVIKNTLVLQATGTLSHNARPCSRASLQRRLLHRLRSRRSGLGQGMAEAFARQMNGRAHIIGTADGWAHFVSCDASVCARLRARLTHMNFLVITAAGPGENSMVACGETSEALDNYLAVHYFARYVSTKELLPLLASTQNKGQYAHMMSVLRGELGLTVPNEDLGFAAMRARTINILHGFMLSVAALKGIIRGVAYNDGLVAHFAAQNPGIAFTHISPGQVNTIGVKADLG